MFYDDLTRIAHVNCHANAIDVCIGVCIDVRSHGDIAMHTKSMT